MLKYTQVSGHTRHGTCALTRTPLVHRRAPAANRAHVINATAVTVALHRAMSEKKENEPSLTSSWGPNSPPHVARGGESHSATTAQMLSKATVSAGGHALLKAGLVFLGVSLVSSLCPPAAHAGTPTATQQQPTSAAAPATPSNPTRMEIINYRVLQVRLHVASLHSKLHLLMRSLMMMCLAPAFGCLPRGGCHL